MQRQTRCDLEWVQHPRAFFVVTFAEARNFSVAEIVRGDPLLEFGSEDDDLSFVFKVKRSVIPEF